MAKYVPSALSLELTVSSEYIYIFLGSCSLLSAEGVGRSGSRTTRFVQVLCLLLQVFPRFQSVLIGQYTVAPSHAVP